MSVRDDGNAYALDESGHTASPAYFTCRGWTGLSPLHLVLDPGGRFQVANGLDEARRVLCCEGSQSVRVLGASEGQVDCDEGFSGLQVACADRFEGGFPCSVNDYLNAPHIGEIVIDALVRPSFKSLSVRSDGNPYALDESGHHARPDGFTCGGWSGQVGLHLMARAGGRLDLMSVANQRHPVLCCGRN